MAIDASIYAQNMPDIAGSFEKGLTIRDMLNKRDKEAKAQKKEQDLTDAYNAGVTKNPDGTISYDGMKTASKLSDLGYGRESVETMQNYKAQQKASLEEQRQELSEMTDYLGRASEALKQNPNLYQNILQDAKARGFDVSSMPQMYGPDAQKMIDYYHGQNLTVKDQLENQFKQQAQGLKEKEFGLSERKTAAEIAKLQAEAAKTRSESNSRTGFTDGQKTADKEFAKDYNDWTGGGASRARTEIDKIKGVVSRLKEGKGTTGGMTGMLGDRFTSNDVLQNRADIQQSAMSLIKTLLSGATSDKDREQIVNTLWNEADSTENNIKRIERFAKDMEARANDNDAKSKYFERSQGTLKGFRPISEKEDINTGWQKQNPKNLLNKKDSKPMPETVTQNGYTYTLNPKTGKYE